ncbi:hypothetical protein WSK_0585 [Novosphingobium sp. Rr 2-17]|nr:hypothetical protein WSK_0585 [Novosphingobium sp. Rr 2-17]
MARIQRWPTIIAGIEDFNPVLGSGICLQEPLAEPTLRPQRQRLELCALAAEDYLALMKDLRWRMRHSPLRFSRMSS